MPSNKRTAIRLVEVIRTLFYTPIYVSVGGGFLETEGLDVDFKTCPAEFGHPINALNTGQADIAQSGIMRCIIASDWGAETVPIHFAEINSRDGFFVISRTKNDNFEWEHFKQGKVIPVDFCPMPWASFRYALQNHNIDPSEVDLLTGLNLNDAMENFRSGKAEYIHVPQPAAEELLEDGSGHLAVALGPENGHLAYSSFATTHKFLEKESDIVYRFTVGYANALDWLASHSPSEIGEAVSGFFPGISLELVTKSITRLKAQDNWPTEPTLAQPQYENLQDILISAGLAKIRQSYDKVVRTNITEAVLASRK
ncbi:MAG: ABC transporter substrate-binding protein [Chloroflexota bacterium]|nr:ABC transporter substrate-binding protein [Chloroflexota bacterium]